MVRLALIAVALFAAHRLGIAFFDPTQGVSPIWPASGVALAALVLSERRAWPGVLAAIFAAALGSNFVSGIAPLTSFGFAASNVLECWLAALVIGAVGYGTYYYAPDLKAYLDGMKMESARPVDTR